MGCTGSKQAQGDRHRSPSPLTRCYSMPVHHPPQRKGDSTHVVALTSTTLGSLRLDSLREGCGHRGCPHCAREADDDADEPMKKTLNDRKPTAASSPVDVDGFSAEVLKAKAWSEMIKKRIPAPKTPTKTPPNEPEVINTWELMEGLEDASPLYRFPVMERSCSLHSGQETSKDVEPKPKPKRANGSVSPEPMWMEVDGVDSDEADAFISDFDPEIISSFRKAFEDLSPKHPLHLTAQVQPDEPEKLDGDENRRTKDDDHRVPVLTGIVQASISDEPEKLDGDENRRITKDDEYHRVPVPTGIVQARISAFQGKIDAKKAAFRPCKRPPGSEGKVVFYFTSLRGVRRTYEDCCAVRVILRSYAVRVDERDVSMHGGFKEELNAILGPGFSGNRLPRVFADGRYLGGVEEVRHMHDAGDLWEALEGCEVLVGGKDASCRACGDVRFVPCETCSGSCKVYVEEVEGGEEEPDGEKDKDSGGFRRCPDCNENGLVRCPVCCSG